MIYSTAAGPSVSISISIYIYICLYIWIYIYIYISVSISLSLYIYIYIYIYVFRVGPLRLHLCRKGTNEVSTTGVTVNVMFFDRGTFWALSLAYFYLPKSARAFRFPNLSKFMIFAAAPLVLTPFVRNQVCTSAHSPPPWKETHTRN